ncbi:uncharacterized protein KQ657_001918 [Scheffersomyces spartinae]|uniref:Uncharacterized protein n=1 Tax=Scheffersomyces spartinae TaxID=45513 RepID=A0A9P7V6D3_9ASCO|nr:uncharacterized protein KQ657_001918 [Scheffersomyces spartinae]KAG7192200.1 hypothetical protein KQ657_001918 [Scheffersomyces spartinae]
MAPPPHECHVCQKTTKTLVEDSKLCVLCQEETRLLIARERDLEAIHKQSQDQVNAIFDLIDHPQINLLLDKELVHLTKFLTIQFNKLKMLNLNIELNTIHAAIDSLKYRIKYLNVEVDLAREGIDTKTQVLAQQRNELLFKYHQTLKALDTNAQDYQQHNVHQIRRHVVKQTLVKYKALKLLVFTTHSKELLFFYGQPIIAFGEFMSCNILVLNDFLENLVRLQIHLESLFSIDLPYLEGLRAYLPVSEFYNSRQEKELELKGEEDQHYEEHEAEQEDQHHQQPFNNIVGDNSEKVLKLGDQIKLPLSSKTLNRQRRLSVIDPKIITSSSSRGPSPTTQKDESSTKSASRTASPMGNKKMVIVPHRILRLPFSRLSIRDFLRFLLVLSKILINFDYFLLHVGSRESTPYDMYDLLQQVHDVDKCLQPQQQQQQQQHDTSDRSSISTVDIQPVMEKLYELIIVKPLSDTRKGPPELLRNLNVRDFIYSYKVKHDWDVIQ